MRRFYEFHDSLLESIEQDGDRIFVQLRAVRSEIREGEQRPSQYLRQEIRLVLEGAKLSVDAADLPSWLLEGEFRAEAVDADANDTGVEGTLPVSLRSARGVELILAGLHEGSGDFVTVRVRADFLTLQPLGEPQFLQHTRASI